MDNIKCITIIHPVERIKEYRWLSAFFRLMGIFVCENILGEEREEETDFTIKIEQGKDGESWSDIAYRRRDEKKFQSILQNDLPEYEEKEWVNVILNIMKNQFQNNTFAEIKCVEKQFVEQDLMRGSYAIEYFGETNELKIFEYMTGSRERFFLAYQELEKNYPEPESKYLLAAICNCQRRMNELYTIIRNAINNKKLSIEFVEYLKEFPYQAFENINDRINKILFIDPNFYGAYAIRGFVKQIDEKKLLEAVFDFEDAVECIGDHAYASHLLYRMGKYFEITRSEEGLQKFYYMLSYKADPYNYRAIYKIAVYYSKKGEQDSSLDYFGKILDILGKKKNLSSLQPIECAYLYKTNRNIGEIYVKRREYKKGIAFLEEAVTYGTIRENMDFYRWMFGEEAAIIFKRVAVEKLKLNTCYDSLADAYAMSNQLNKMKESIGRYKADLINSHKE